MARGGSKGTVRCFVLAHEEEGLFLVSAVEPLDGLVSGEVGAIPVKLFGASVHLLEDGIVVVALAGKDFPVVKTNWV